MTTPVKAFPNHRSEGMDLRDYFAAKAMQAILSDGDIFTLLGKKHISIKTVTNASYEWADEMMQAREVK